MTTTRQQKLVKRSRAAELLDRSPRSLKRWEALGLLTPIHLNCRSVAYAEGQILNIMRGQCAFPANPQPTCPAPRSAAGTFTRRAAATPA